MKLILLIFGMAVLGVGLSARTSLGGKITDLDSQEELIGANVVVFKNDVYVSGTSSDFDGNYKVNLEPGIYDVEVSYIGYPTQEITGVLVEADQVNTLDIAMEGRNLGIIECYVIQIRVPIIEMDLPIVYRLHQVAPINCSPNKEIQELILQLGGLTSSCN